MIEQWMGFAAVSGVPGLLIIFAVLLACGLGLPIPEDITLVAGGILVSEGSVRFSHVLAVSFVGILLGDCLIFAAGRRWGVGVFRNKWLSKMVNETSFLRAERAFHRFGHKIIFLARFMPGLRGPIYFYAGSVRLPFWNFLLVDTLAAAVSVPLWIFLGKVFGDNIPLLEDLVRKVKFGTAVSVILLAGLLVGAHFYRKKVVGMIDRNGTGR